MFLKNISKAALSLVILTSLAGCSSQKEKEQAPQEVAPIAQEIAPATQEESAVMPDPVAPEAQPQTEAQQPS